MKSHIGIFPCKSMTRFNVKTLSKHASPALHDTARPIEEETCHKSRACGAVVDVRRMCQEGAVSAYLGDDVVDGGLEGGGRLAG